MKQIRAVGLESQVFENLDRLDDGTDSRLLHVAVCVSSLGRVVARRKGNSRARQRWPLFLLTYIQLFHTDTQDDR